MDAREAKEKLMDAVRATSPLQTQRQYLGMSQIGRCPQLQYQWFMDSKGPVSDRMYLNAISGYMYEAKVRELLITAGVVVRNQYSQGPVGECELVAPFDERFRGHTDGETRDGDLLEIKSFDREGFDDLIDGQRLPDVYFDQVQAYLRYGRYDRALVIAVQRGALDFWTLSVRRSDLVGARVEEKAKRILAAIDRREPPPCECGRCGQPPVARQYEQRQRPRFIRDNRASSRRT